MSPADRESERPPDVEDLEDVLQRCLDRDPSEWAAALEVACAERPDLSADLRRRFGALRSHGLASGSGTPPRTSLPGYEIDVLLGGGGMGVVYAGTRAGDGRTVAVKFLHPHLLTSAGARARFQREVELATRLSHPNLCEVIESGVHDGTPFIVMERVSGSSLADWIEPRRRGDLSPGDLRDLVGWIEQIARALAALHAIGLIHRDVKPANIMLAADGRAVLLDFGLALESGMPRMTGSGEWVGSPAYMSPEAIAGRGVDARHDVYGLGVTLFEALTGRLPFTAPTREGLFHAILRAAPPDLGRLCPAASADVELLVATALAKESSHRYQTAADLARDLRAVLRGAPLSIRRPGGGVRVARWIARNRVATTVGAALVAGLAGTLFFLQESRVTLQRTQALASASAADRAEPEEAIELATAAVEQFVDRATVSSLQAAVASYHRWWTVAALPSTPLAVAFASSDRIGVRCGEQWRSFAIEGGAVSGGDPPAAALLGQASEDGADPRSAGSTDGRATWSRVSGAADALILQPPGRDPVDLRLARPVLRVAIAASDDRLAVLCEDNSIWIFTIDGAAIGAIPFHGVLVHSFAFSQDGRLLASGDGDGVVRIYRDDGQHVGELIGHGGLVSCVAFDIEGRRLVTGSQDDTVRVWEVRPVGMIDRHEDWVVSLDVIGDSLLSADAAGHVMVHRAGLGERVRLKAAGRIADAVFAGRPDLVAVCSRPGPTEILDLAGGRDELEGVRDQRALAFAAGLLVVGGGDTVSGAVESGRRWERSWSRAIDSEVVAVAASGRAIAAATGDGMVHLFDRKGVPGHSFAAHADLIWGLCFSPEGDLLITTSRDNHARGWDLDGALRFELGDHRHTVSCAAFSPDGATLATAATDGRVRLWTRTGAELAMMRGHRGQVWGLAFRADGRALFTGSYDRTVRRWPVPVEDLLSTARDLIGR